MKIVVGLTGGIASGKSAAARHFEALGAHIIDTDIISREVAEKGGAGYASLKEAFPDAFFEGVLDRRKLRNIVFGNDVRRHKLDAIMHPLIRLETEKRAGKISDGAVFIVAPLLFEAGFDSACDLTLLISCKTERRIDRLIVRDNISVGQAEAAIRAQLSEEERLRRSDCVIFNDGSPELLEKNCALFYDRLTEVIKGGENPSSLKGLKFR